MTKYIKTALMLFGLFFMAACSEDSLNSISVFDTPVVEEKTDFDNWIMANYTNPYNIQFLYRYVDSETNNTYNVIPPTLESAKAMAILIKYVWIGAYNEAMGSDVFMKTFAPRILQMTGSFQYKGDGSRTIGTAEGGVKVTLFGTNNIDIDNPWIEQDAPYTDRSSNRIDMNYWYFHTMHHEFCHILTQTKNYPSEFQKISVSDQRLGDWVNVKDNEAPGYGFVSGYATSEYNEDFAEIYSIYVTHTQEAWNTILADADRLSKDETFEGGAVNPVGKIEEKLTAVKSYFEEVWGLDMDNLRDIVLRRSKEALLLDLRNLPNDVNYEKVSK